MTAEARRDALLRLVLDGLADRFKSEQDAMFARTRRLRTEHTHRDESGNETYDGDHDAHYELGSAEGMHAAMVMAERELRKVIAAL